MSSKIWSQFYHAVRRLWFFCCFLHLDIQRKKKIFKDAVKVVKSISQHLIKCWRVVIFHLRKYFLKRPLEKFPRILSFCQCRWQIPNNNNKKELPNISIEQRPKYVLLNAEHTSLKIIETVLFIFCVRRTNNRYVVFHL